MHKRKRGCGDDAATASGGGGAALAVGGSGGAAGGSAAAGPPALSAPAAAAAGAAADYSDYECCICTNILYDPATLSCGAHNACIDCLTVYIAKGGHAAKFCPLCRVPTHAPAGGLAVNVLLRRAVEQVVPAALRGGMAEPLCRADVTRTTLERFKRKAAAGDGAGQAYLGMCFHMGWRVPRDNAEAERLLRLAHAQGCAAGTGWLGILLTSAPGAAAARQGEGLEHLQAAAEAGHAVSMSSMGILHRWGDFGVGVDLKTAFKWFKRAAAAGHARSTRVLGHCHANGDGTRANPARAAACFEKAVALGDVPAGAYLAEVLALGRGVPVDEGRALQLMRSAAGKRDPLALYLLGLWYDKGMCGLAADTAAAMDWWKRGRDAKNAMCTFKLAEAALAGFAGTDLTRGHAMTVLEMLASCDDLEAATAATLLLHRVELAVKPRRSW
jgi:TPR repeat protein